MQAWLGDEHLDRQAHERAHPELLAALAALPGTLSVQVQGVDVLVESTMHGLAPVMTPYAELPPLPGDRTPLPGDGDSAGSDGCVDIFLGRLADGTAVVGRSLPALSAVQEPSSWQGLRLAGPQLAPGHLDAVMTTVASGNWHASHGYCSRCGSATRSSHAGWVRVCSREEHPHHVFPRTDPAVIMAVIDADDRLLLGRGPQWDVGRMSVLAGFVEPGESLEAAVAREVAEEVGVTVEAVTYVGSQPWPFPASLMLGFTALAVTTDLHLDLDEIAEARWVTRAELDEDVRSGRLGLPGRLSIARRLIEGWYGEPLRPPTERDGSPTR